MVMGRLRRMAGTRFHNEECPNEAHPSTNALMRKGKQRGFMGVERKSNRREFAPQKWSKKRLKKKKCLRKVSPLTNLMAPQEKMKLAMKSEGAGCCDLDEMDVADSTAIK